jgi:site-specific recombinase XerD
MAKLNQTLEYIGQFLDYSQHRRNHSPATIRTRRCVLTMLANDAEVRFPRKTLLTLDAESIEQLLDRRHLAPKTRDSYLDCLKAFFKWSMRLRYCKVNPMPDTERPQLPPPDPNPLTEDELRRCIDLAPDQRMRLMVLLAAYAGLRVAEIANCQHSWIDLTDSSDPVINVMGKGKRNRTVPLHPKLLNALGEYGLDYRSSALLFTYRGNKISDTTVSRLISDHLRGCGIKGKTGHKLRHRFGTRLYEQTNDIYYVSEMLGHASLQVTLRYVKPKRGERRRSGILLLD